MEDKHKLKMLSEHIEQLDGNMDVPLLSANSTFKDGIRNPIDQNNKPIEEENYQSHALTALPPAKDGPEIKMIDKHIQDLDPKMLANMSVKELSDLNAKITRKVGLEMQLKLMPPCDVSYLKLAVSKFIMKHMKV